MMTVAETTIMEISDIIVLADKDHETLVRLARLRGKSKAAIIRDALALEKWFQETKEGSGRVLVERNGKAREIVRR